MKIVIDIPEGLKNEFESEQWTALSCMEMKDALIHGKPYEERKTGKWIVTARNGVLCSECKSGTRKMPMLLGNPLYKYCPFCGAKIEGVEK